MGRADERLYAAKERRRNGVELEGRRQSADIEPEPQPVPA